MLGRQLRFVNRVQRITDAALFCICFWVAHQLRASGAFDYFWPRPDIDPFEAYLWYLLVILPLTPLSLQFQGFYNRAMLSPRRRGLWQLFWGTALVSAALIIASFLAKQEFARGVIVLFAGISFLSVAAKEELVRRWRLSRMGQAQARRRFILLGAEEDTTQFKSRLKDQPASQMELISTVDLSEVSIKDLVELIHQHSVNGVILTTRHTYFGRVEEVIAACELEGVEVWLMADFFKTQISQTTIDDFQGRPMLVFSSTPAPSWQSLCKQILDLAGASILLLVLSPFMILAAVMIKLTSPGPILFRQERCGLNGRPFRMLKFRSMTTDAEQRRHELEVLNEMSGPVFKVTNDPRITKVGGILRKYSIDEFPQLFNVLTCDMSLVGPRPLPVDEVARFDDLAHRRRLSVRPGITCLWQVSGRNNVTDFEDWVRLDLEYIDNWSLWLDLKILARTIPVVLLGTGAR